MGQSIEAPNRENKRLYTASKAKTFRGMIMLSHHYHGGSHVLLPVALFRVACTAAMLEALHPQSTHPSFPTLGPCVRNSLMHTGSVVAQNRSGHLLAVTAGVAHGGIALGNKIPLGGLSGGLGGLSES